MELTKLQNDLVIEIANQNILHVNTLLERMGNLDPYSTVNCNFNRQTVKFRIIHDVNQTVFVPRNEKYTKSIITEYIALVKILEKEGLIIQIPYSVNGLIFPLVKKIIEGDSFRLAQDPSIQGLIASIDEIEIFPLPALESFIENDFRTDSEIRHHNEQLKYDEERKERKSSQRMTVAIAVFSILVSILAAIFNVYTFDKQRNVTITNPGAFNDTARVIILNSKPQQIDSLIDKIKVLH